MKKSHRTTRQHAQNLDSEIPNGYMSLATFEEIFHRKLDEYYKITQK